MFITENQNLGDSVLFLLSGREALAGIVEATGTENSEELVAFIRNEASDYEVMHLLLNGSLPEEKYNDVAEMLLFSEMKESMMMNKDFVEEMVGEEIFYNILNEVDSLYMTTSTAAPILEFEAQTNFEIAVAQMLSEYPTGSRVGAVAKKAGETKAQYMARVDAARAAAAKAKQTAATAATKMKGGAGMTKAVGKGVETKAQYMAKMDKARAAADAKRKMHQATGSVKGAKGAYLKNKYVKPVSDKAAELKSAAKKTWAKATGTDAYQQALKKGPGKHMGQLPPAKVGLKQQAANVAKFAGKGIKAAALSPAGKVVGGAAAAALAIYAGNKVYKRFFSQAAKACGGQSGAAKTACMNKYRKQAIMKQASAVQSAASTCAKSKNPEKCKAGVAAKVQALKAKAAKIAA